MKRLISVLLLLAAAVLCLPVQAETAVPLPDFALTDQYGRVWTPADLEGKVVFLNWWTTWCPWCVQEMPDIETLYHEYGDNEGDVIFLGVDTPETVDTADWDGIVAFLAEKGITYPVLNDTEDALGTVLGIQAFPTTFIVKPDGTILGKIEGAVDIDTMRQAIAMGAE